MAEAPELSDLSTFPLVNPTKPTSLRRSHSVASLPTPPTTIRKRARSRASSAFSSDDEDAPVSASADDDLLGVKASPQPEPRKKKRRVGDKDRVVAHKPSISTDATEDDFWGPDRPKLDEAKFKAEPKTRERSEKREPSVTASASRAAAAAALPSPPPTRPRPPVTPPRRIEKGKDKTARPVRDSPNNPFLESPGSGPASPPGPKTPLAEPPTMTYVFRGKKQVFVNPNYKAPADPRADLPETHPDYSPGERLEPRRLFKRGPTHPGAVKAKHKTPPPKRARTPDPWDSDEEAGDEAPLPRVTLADKFAHAAEESARKRGEATTTTLARAEVTKASSTKAKGKEREPLQGKVTASSRSRSSSKKASEEPAPKASKGDKADVRPPTSRHYGQPKLVLAPTRSRSKSSSSSLTLDHVAEEDEGEAHGDAPSSPKPSSKDKDPWSLPVLS